MWTWRNGWASNLCSIRGPLKVPGHEEVDDGSTDALRGQDERQRPPEAQHLFNSGVTLRRTRQTQRISMWKYINANENGAALTPTSSPLESGMLSWMLQ